MLATSIDAVLEVLDEVIATGRPLLLKNRWYQTFSSLSSYG
jgi:hypothetical protein